MGAFETKRFERKINFKYAESETKIKLKEKN